MAKRSGQSQPPRQGNGRFVSRNKRVCFSPDKDKPVSSDSGTPASSRISPETLFDVMARASDQEAGMLANKAEDARAISRRVMRMRNQERELMASVAELKKEESTLKGQVGDPLIDKTDILARIDWLKMRREWFITDVDRLRMKHTSFRRHIEGLVDTRIEARARVKSLEKAYSEVESRPPLRRLVRMADLNESFGRIAPERKGDRAPSRTRT